MRFFPTLLAVSSLTVFEAFGQQGQPEVTSHESTVTFSSKVNMVSVPVVVRQSDGKAIGNLKQEDFQLFDKGKQQIITKFTVEHTESVVTEAPAAARTQQPSAAAT